jgi:hypothetical protein
MWGSKPASWQASIRKPSVEGRIQSSSASRGVCELEAPGEVVGVLEQHLAGARQA